MPSTVMDSNPSQPLASTPVDTELHKEVQQAAGANIFRKNNALKNFTAEADLEFFAPNDYVPHQQGPDKGSKNYTSDHIFAWSKPSVLIDKTKSTRDGSQTAHTISGTKMDKRSAFMYDEDEPFIASKESKQDKEKADAEMATLKAQSVFPDINQLTKHMASSEPFMRFSITCGVDGQGAWDAKLDLAYSHNYIMEEMLGKLGFVRLDYGDYGRKTVKEVRVKINGFNFLVDFLVIDYANEGERFVVFGRDFLLTTKYAVEVGSTSGKLVKMGKASHNKTHNVNKLTSPTPLKIEEITPISSIAQPPVYHPLFPKQKEKILEVLDRKYKELKEQKHIAEVLENYMIYRKKLDEVMMGRARLENKEFGDKEKSRLMEHGLPKKLCDPANFVLPVHVNGTTQMNTGASVSVLPYALYKNLGLSDPRPYHSNLTMVDNTQAKAMEETCGAIIDMGHGTMTIDDGVTRHTYFPKPRAKAYSGNFEVDEDEDWLVFLKWDVKKMKLIDFLCSLLVQLKITDWGSEGHGVYKKTEGDGAWHAKFEERAFLIRGDVYPKWCWEFFLPLYFERGVDRTKIMKEKCIWFRLCGEEHVLTLLEFAILLGLYKKNDLEHRLFAIHFNNLEINENGFDHNAYWKRTGEPTRTNKRTFLVKDPLMRIVHKLLVGAFIHRTGSRERCQKLEL
nr:hypothetical protein [Tanacetum cinerariifolium]